MTRRNGLLGTLALTLAGAIVATMVVSCGIRPSVVIPGQEAPRGAVTSLIVYLLQDHTTLRAVSRPLPPTDTPVGKGSSYYPPYPSAQAAVDALLAGPTATEAAGGLTSDIPSTNVNAFFVSGAEGNVYQLYIEVGDGTPLSQHAVDQVVCTVSAAFTSTGNLPDGTSVQVQVLDKRSPKRDPQRCPATP